MRQYMERSLDVGGRGSHMKTQRKCHVFPTGRKGIPLLLSGAQNASPILIANVEVKRSVFM